MTIPVPWFGGKSRAAALIWERFGPTLPRVATGNDINGFVANFFRAVSGDPESVARAADRPVHEIDLHAIHKWLLADAAGLRERLDADPDYFDAVRAGRWAWGASAWIGSGWAEESAPKGHVRQLPEMAANNSGDKARAGFGTGIHAAGMREPSRKLPDLSGATDDGKSYAALGTGVHAAGMREPSRRLPDLAGGTQWGTDEPNQRPGKGVHGAMLREPSRQLPDLGTRQVGEGGGHQIGRGVHSPERRTRLYDIFAELQRRLRYVRFSCGDAFRILTPAVTYRHGRTAILLDAPYEGHEYVYGAQDVTVRPPSPKALAKMTREEQAMWEELTPLYDQTPRGSDVEERVAGRINARGERAVAPSLSRRFQAYARTHGNRPDLRIAICGYEGEHDVLEREGWECVAWTAKGGYGNQSEGGNENKRRERLWFSPHCLRPGRNAGQLGLFAGAA